LVYWGKSKCLRPTALEGAEEAEGNFSLAYWLGMAESLEVGAEEEAACKVEEEMQEADLEGTESVT
jgi:hypothetical protein